RPAGLAREGRSCEIPRCDRAPILRSEPLTMSAPKRRWRGLVPGIIALIVVAALAASVLMFARIGQLHGKKYRLIVLADEARGLIKGSDVWLDGQKVGVVQELEFRPPTTDMLTRLRIPIEVLIQYQPQIRHDSRVQIRSGGSMIGAPVVFFSTGTPSSPMLRDGDIVPLSAKQVDLEGLTSEFAMSARDFPSIISGIKSIAGNAGDVVARMGELRASSISIQPMLVSANRLTARAVNGNGTVSLLLGKETPVLTRARQVLARAESLVKVVRSPSSLAGRVRGDSALMHALGDVRNEVSIVRARLAEPRGTAGRVLADSAIVKQLGQVERDIAALLADFKKHPARYIVF
ncbi:MAG: MlaD family protein, partial [Gemmatimonadaceae bacterium]